MFGFLLKPLRMLFGYTVVDGTTDDPYRENEVMAYLTSDIKTVGDFEKKFGVDLGRRSDMLIKNYLKENDMSLQKLANSTETESVNKLNNK